MDKTLIERLRTGLTGFLRVLPHSKVYTPDITQVNKLMREAADELERLQKEKTELQEVNHGSCWDTLHTTRHKRAECWSCCPFCATELHNDFLRLTAIVEKQKREIEGLKARWQSKVQDIQIAANDSAAENYKKVEVVQAKEIERLLTIVKKLPKTADGVPVVLGDIVYVHRKFPIDAVIPHRVIATGSSMIASDKEELVCLDLAQKISYSTRAAAIEAKETSDAEEEECETCKGTGCVDAPFSVSDPCCPDCDGEGK